MLFTPAAKAASPRDATHFYTFGDKSARGQIPPPKKVNRPVGGSIFPWGGFVFWLPYYVRGWTPLTTKVCAFNIV